jgi:hypothetical protein
MTLLVLTAQYQLPTTNFKLPKKYKVYSMCPIGQDRDAHVSLVTCQNESTTRYFMELFPSL